MYKKLKYIQSGEVLSIDDVLYIMSHYQKEKHRFCVYRVPRHYLQMCTYIDDKFLGLSCVKELLNYKVQVTSSQLSLF